MKPADVAYPVPTEKDTQAFRDVFAYWQGKFHGDRLPGRADIDPLELRPFLGRIALIDVIREGDALRFRYRLMGVRIVALFGHDFTGNFIEDALSPDRFDSVNAAFTGVVKTGQPHFWEIPVPAPDRDFRSLRRLLLPLASDGVTVDMLFGFALEVHRKEGDDQSI